MKNISLALNGVLIIAVIILYYLHFSNSSATADATAENGITKNISDSTSVKEIIEPPNSNIGYLDMDSLREEYKLYSELINKLKASEKMYTREINAKTEKLKGKWMELQKLAPTLTQFEGENRQRELAKEEEDIYKTKEEYAIKFQAEQEKLDRQFQKTIADYIENYNKEADYDIIIGGADIGSKVMYFKKGLNITDAVVAGLNDEYDNKKEAGKKGKGAK